METIYELGQAVWAWRTVTQPDSGDDLPRVDRPAGWVADWSAAAVAARRAALADFEERLAAIPDDGPVPARVDRRLVGSALARARWELDRLRSWQRNPVFYLDQSLGPVHRALLTRTPDEAEVRRHLARVPETLRHARENLTGHAAAPFADSAVRLLGRAVPALGQSMAALGLDAAAVEAQRALAGFAEWLRAERATFAASTAVPDIGFLLHRVALLPWSAERIRQMAAQEWNRAVALEAVLRQGVPQSPPLPADVAEQIARQRRDEEAVRRFCDERDLLTVPADARWYRYAPMPPHLAPLSWLGVADDLAEGNDAFRFVPDPAGDLGYFDRAAAVDPRLTICHEGVHALQLALTWQHPDPLRRRFYDSTPNEGIAFYYEELMLTAGLFADAPASAAVIANFLRLRALRADLDIGLASGAVSIEEAAERLARDVPMDRASAWDEAVMFAGCPGQGLSYLVGKMQILDLLAAGGGRDGLRAFHDGLWRDGNVPLALFGWEHHGQLAQLAAADRLAAATPRRADQPGATTATDRPAATAGLRTAAAG
ncbi:DUF885 family protein [Micromonospora sp. WMMD882]|uniref:DUF885 family protein n=1 Tax=Micromonospora sp. WMMD882 TaxID=3015151 RepID=UPI00248C4D37|nr:DUF885 family protein [Micromonospora sp. WMMD882]WBB78057.1 DUF885 family protein [Micromonospora sp. WMMD882]